MDPLSVGKGEIDYQATAKAGNAQSLIRYLPGMLLLQSDLGFRVSSILEENGIGQVRTTAEVLILVAGASF